MSNLKIEKEDINKHTREIFIEQLSKGHSIRMIIKGRCMYPLINRGDFLTVKPVKFNQTRTGDIIAYKKPSHDGFTIHRILKKGKDTKGEYLVTKGDASLHGDPHIYPEDLYGKVITIERREGKVINLESKFSRMQGFLTAKRSRLLTIIKYILKSPHLVPNKVIRKVKGLFFNEHSNI